MCMFITMAFDWDPQQVHGPGSESRTSKPRLLWFTNDVVPSFAGASPQTADPESLCFLCPGFCRWQTKNCREEIKVSEGKAVGVQSVSS